MLNNRIEKKKKSIIQKNRTFLAIISQKKALTNLGPTYQVMLSGNLIERKMKKITKVFFFKKKSLLAYKTHDSSHLTGSIKY
jgi:hypothetical protein